MLDIITMVGQNEISKANAVTHGGVFHADEVFATVLLSKVLPEVKLCRTFKVPEDIADDVIVYDIGGGSFDHHQKDFAESRDGIKYSSFGLLWKRFGMEILAEYENAEWIFRAMDDGLVKAIDAVDNGQANAGSGDIPVVTVSNIIAACNPNWDEEVDADECFLDAVKVAEGIFDRALKGTVAKVKAKDTVERAIEDSADGIMVLDEFVPWQSHLFNSSNQKAKEILYVVYPSLRGGYNVNCVPDVPGGFGQRKPLPKEWAGLKDESLAAVSGVKAAVFCHPARFICSAMTKSDAICMARKACEEEA